MYTTLSTETLIIVMKQLQEDFVATDVSFSEWNKCVDFLKKVKRELKCRGVL